MFTPRGNLAETGKEKESAFQWDRAIQSETSKAKKNRKVEADLTSGKERGRSGEITSRGNCL